MGGAGAYAEGQFNVTMGVQFGIIVGQIGNDDGNNAANGGIVFYIVVEPSFISKYI